MVEVVRVREKATGKIGTWKDRLTTSGFLQILVAFDGENTPRAVFFHDLEYYREGVRNNA
jgi:hypothetical protein